MRNDAEIREQIRENVWSSYNSNTEKCKDEKELGTKIDDGKAYDVNQYFKKEKFEKTYKDVKAEAIQTFTTMRRLKELEENAKRQPEVHYEYIYREFEESKKVRREREQEERNRQTASNELPNIIKMTKNVFSLK